MMNNLNAGNTPIVNPHLLTPKALKIARGETVNGISDADWESYLLWEERCDIIKPVLTMAVYRELGYGLAIMYR